MHPLTKLIYVLLSGKIYVEMDLYNVEKFSCSIYMEEREGRDHVPYIVGI